MPGVASSFCIFSIPFLSPPVHQRKGGTVAQTSRHFTRNASEGPTWRIARFHLSPNSHEFPLTTFSLLKTSYIMRFELTSCYPMLGFEHHFSLQIWMNFRKTQNPKWFLSFPFFSCMLELSQENVNLKSQSPLNFLELGCTWLSFPWIYVLASKNHAKLSNNEEY